MSLINHGCVLGVEWLRNLYHNIKILNIGIYTHNSVAYGYTSIPPVKMGAYYATHSNQLSKSSKSKRAAVYITRSKLTLYIIHDLIQG